jgi:thioredoxin reductase (NADPH)
VYLIHRRDTLRASKIMADRALGNSKIQPVWDSVVEDIYDVSKDTVTGVKIKNLKTGQVGDLDCAGVFVAIGHQPNTDIYKGQIELADDGYIVCKKGTYTTVDGVFGAGDCVDRVYRQAVTAAGTGCMAALEAERWLSHHDLTPTEVHTATASAD